MKFVQIIDFRSSKGDDVQKLTDEWVSSGAGKGRVGRGMMCADRDDPGRYVNIVEFPSYEAAMANSNDPDTQAFAAKMSALAEGPPTFVNLDVLQEYS